jgi:hypothetical protein
MNFKITWSDFTLKGKCQTLIKAVTVFWNGKWLEGVNFADRDGEMNEIAD